MGGQHGYRRPKRFAVKGSATAKDGGFTITKPYDGGVFIGKNGEFSVRVRLEGTDRVPEKKFKVKPGKRKNLSSHDFLVERSRHFAQIHVEEFLTERLKRMTAKSTSPQTVPEVTEIFVNGEKVARCLFDGNFYAPAFYNRANRSCKRCMDRSKRPKRASRHMNRAKLSNGRWYRLCSGCRGWLLAVKDNFWQDPRKPDNCSSRCKPCCKNYPSVVKARQQSEPVEESSTEPRFGTTVQLAPESNGKVAAPPNGSVAEKPAEMFATTEQIDLLHDIARLGAKIQQIEEGRKALNEQLALLTKQQEKLKAEAQELQTLLMSDLHVI